MDGNSLGWAIYVWPHLLVDQSQELQPLLMAMPSHELADPVSAEDLDRSQQTGPRCFLDSHASSLRPTFLRRQGPLLTKSPTRRRSRSIHTFRTSRSARAASGAQYDCARHFSSVSGASISIRCFQRHSTRKPEAAFRQEWLLILRRALRASHARVAPEWKRRESLADLNEMLSFISADDRHTDRKVRKKLRTRKYAEWTTIDNQSSRRVP
jgi:hypothetical protein